MEKFNRRFPQVFIALYTGSLRDVANIRPFSFWLLNRAVYQDAPSSLANDACILLTIDPETKAASMVFGYLLDPYLNEQDTFECLSRAHPYWLEGRYAYGIMKALSHLEVILRKKSQKAGRRTKSRDHTSSLADLSDDLDQGDEPAPPSPEPKPSEEVTA